MTNDMENGYPEPTTIRDLRMMYNTCGNNGIIEYERAEGLPSYSRDYREGMVTCHAMAVTPMTYSGTVHVQVYREVVTDLRKNETYCPHRDILWEKTYPSFEKFHDSPFWNLTMNAWKSPRTRWDTRLIDDHEAVDDGDRRWVWGHYYKHETDWLGNDRLSGEIGSVDVYVRDDGYISIDIDYDEVFNGMIQDLALTLKEHETMKEKLETLKTHGIDLNDGTLSIKLWNNANG